MSVQMQQFRVVGVKRTSGEDVSVVIDAATKAAAEVKAEKMDIETTHIVRLKADEPITVDEEELFSIEAAEALTATRTDKLIEEVVPPEEPKITPDPPAPQPKQTQDPVVAAVTRPIYAGTSKRSEAPAAEVSGVRAFGLVLIVILGICAGAYFVLVHEPNDVVADDPGLLFGEDLFSDVVTPHSNDDAHAPMRDAFTGRATAPTNPADPPIAHDEQVRVAPGGGAPSTEPGPLVLQSIVSSHEGRFAVINGRLIREGSAIDGATLMNIADNWVLMQRDGEQFMLQIGSE